MKTMLAVLCLTVLAGCTGKPPAPRADASGQAHAASVTTPWDAMKNDEQRARNVQQLVNKQAAKENKQIEQQTQ